MKNSLTWVFLLMGISLSLIAEQPAVPVIPSEEMATIKQVVQMATAPSEVLDQKVWPTFQFLDVPLVITLNNSHLFAIGLNSSNPQWQHLDVDGTAVLYSDEDVWHLSDKRMQANVDIDDQQAFVFRLSDNRRDPHLPLLIFIHESFHFHQFAKFENRGQSKEYPDVLNKENLALMILEEKLLADFFKVNSSEARQQLLIDLVAVYTHRQQSLQPISIEWELDQQKMEGLADYVSMKFLDEVSLFDNFRGEERLARVLSFQSRPEGISGRALRHRHYAVGAALAYALDFLKVTDWKQRIQDGSTQIALLQEKLHLSADVIEERVAYVKEAYSFETIHQKVDTEVSDHQAYLTDLLGQFDQSEGIVVEMRLSDKIALNGGGSSRGMFSLSDGTSLILQDSSMSATTDNNLSMQTHQLPFLFQSGSSKKFKVSSETTISIDGESYTLMDMLEGKEVYPFSTIALKDQKVDLEASELSGSLIIQDGALTMIFN